MPTTVEIPVVLPLTDLSEPGHAGGSPGASPTVTLGGVLGDGDLTTSDGDASAIRIWSAHIFNSAPQGADIFEYVVPPAALPVGAEITAAEIEVEVRAVPNPDGIVVYWDGVTTTQAGWESDLALGLRDDGDVQVIASPDGGLLWGQPGAALGGALDGDGVSFTASDDYLYHTTTGSIPVQTAAQWNTGGTITFSAYDGLGDNSPTTQYRISRALIRLTFATSPWHVVDSAQAGGTVWRLGPFSNPDGGIARLVLPDGTRYVQHASGAPITLVGLDGPTYPLGQLPMLLEGGVDPGGDTWGTDIGFGAYVWDGGLWLGGDFSDLTGLPAAIPAEASELDFAVLPPGATISVPADPWAVYYILNPSSPTNLFFESAGPTPDPGAHFWVIWYGPAANLATDPEPPNPPSTYAPASLCQNGTG